MKKLAALICLMLISSTVFAATLECGVKTFNATATGLIGTDKVVTSLQAKIQSESDFKLDNQNCLTNSVAGLDLNLCGVEHNEATGVFAALITVTNKGDSAFNIENSNSGAEYLLAQSKKGSTLAILNAKGALSPAFRQKMTAANLEFPEYVGGDSLQIDEAVKIGVEKGIIKKDEVVFIYADSCSLK